MVDNSYPAQYTVCFTPGLRISVRWEISGDTMILGSIISIVKLDPTHLLSKYLVSDRCSLTTTDQDHVNTRTISWPVPHI